MKLKKSFSVSFLFISIFFFFSCASNVVTLPGEKEIKQANLYTEYYNLAESYYKMEDYNNAIKYYEFAMNNKKNYWAAYYKTAKCYAYTQNWDKASQMYKKLLQRDPNNDSLKASLAYLYLMNNDSKNAIGLYESLLSEQSQNKDYLENYLTLLLSDKKLFNENKQKFYSYFESLKEYYPDNEKNQKLQDALEKLTN